MSIKFGLFLFMVWYGKKLLTNSQFLFCGTENPEDDLDLEVSPAPGDSLVRPPICCNCSNYKIDNLKKGVCASNGIHYPNECTYYCALRSYVPDGQRLTKNGTCYYEFKRTVPEDVKDKVEYNLFAECNICCRCREDNHVCATNKLIYKNKCYFKCVQKYYQTYNVPLKEEKCTWFHSFYPKNDTECSCPDNQKPVCGANKEYQNICFFHCARMYWSGLNQGFLRTKCKPAPIVLPNPGEGKTKIGYPSDQAEDRHFNPSKYVRVQCKSSSDGKPVLEVNGSKYESITYPFPEDYEADFPRKMYRKTKHFINFKKRRH